MAQEGSALSLIHSGIISLKKSLALQEKLLLISNGLKDLILEHKPHTLAIEDIFFHKNAKSAFVLGQVRGAILLTASQQACPIRGYSPLEVKQAACGYGRASKEQVADMMMRLFPPLKKSLQSLDESDAVAVAMCHLSSERFMAKTHNTANMKVSPSI